MHYFAPRIITVLFFFGTLIAYFKSDDEAFWLAYFLVLSDGFFSLLGSWEAVLSVIPGLPAIEVVQFYILLTILKAWKRKDAPPLFFSLQIRVIFIYIIFLVIQGQVIGLSNSLNVQFRIVRYILPLLLFYSIPKLITTEKQFKEILTYLFPIAFVVLATQLFSISMGMAPAQFLGFGSGDNEIFEVSEDRTYRGFYNFCIVIITLFGALYFLATKNHNFKPLYLSAVVLANFLSAFLSATRGWILGFSLIIILYFVLVGSFKLKQFVTTAIALSVLIFAMTLIPSVQVQVNNAFNRLLTLESMADGDMTAGGTLLRINERGPRVMKKWRESPITGFGFSDDFFRFSDIHVANQNILLHSGIIGAMLMAWFFITFNGLLFLRSRKLHPKNPLKRPLLVFNIVFLGWFLIHSSSGQHFTYYQGTNPGIMQALFFGFGSIMYYKTFEKEKEKSSPDKKNQDTKSIRQQPEVYA
jgi:hypothetical protein